MDYAQGACPDRRTGSHWLKYMLLLGEDDVMRFFFGHICFLKTPRADTYRYFDMHGYPLLFRLNLTIDGIIVLFTFSPITFPVDSANNNVSNEQSKGLRIGREVHPRSIRGLPIRQKVYPNNEGSNQQWGSFYCVLSTRHSEVCC